MTDTKNDAQGLEGAQLLDEASRRPRRAPDQRLSRITTLLEAVKTKGEEVDDLVQASRDIGALDDETPPQDPPRRK